MELLVNTDGKKHSLRTRFVLACDGRNSVTVKELVRAEKDERRASVTSSKSCGTTSYQSPAEGLNIKAALLNGNFTEVLQPPVSAGEAAELVCASIGERKKRPWNSISAIVFSLCCRKSFEILGEQWATPPEHDIWKVREVVEVDKLFEDNFPQANIRSCISQEQMKNFINAVLLVFVLFRNEIHLLFTSGAASSGVLLMGDAAHTFHHTLGRVSTQHLRMSLFCAGTDESQGDTPLNSILDRYEKLHDEDTSALMKVTRFDAPYQYRQSIQGAVVSQLSGMFRGNLAKFFPDIFHATMIKMLFEI